MKNEEEIFNLIKNNTLDGFEYCQLATNLFEQVILSVDAEIRLKERKRGIKSLIEEIIPISVYVRAHYKVGMKIFVSWEGDGGQSYDGFLEQSGIAVNENNLAQKIFLEVTTAEHKKEHRVRQLLNRDGICFAPKGIDDENRNEIISRCISYDGEEYIDEFVEIIQEIITKKNNKPYLDNTVLIVRCDLNNVYTSTDWKKLETIIRNSITQTKFLEIFVYDSCTEKFFIVRNNQY